MKGRTQQARRKAIERGLKIAGIGSDAKLAVTKAGLDDNRSALREIAKVETRKSSSTRVWSKRSSNGQARKPAKRAHVKKAERPSRCR